MVDILHRVGAESSSPKAVFDALTTLDGLAAWWTDDTRGSTEIGGVVEFRFPAGGFDMKVLDQEAPSRVLWEVVNGPPEWIGTKVHWDLRQDGDYTIVMFKHEGWAEPVEFMHHCSTKWATYIMSMKALVETGTGSPAPRDVHIAFPD